MTCNSVDDKRKVCDSIFWGPPVHAPTIHTCMYQALSPLEGPGYNANPGHT